MQKTAAKSYWRVAYWYGLEDLLQDGEMCWVLVERNYPHVTNPAHLMALFKRYFQNHIHDLANYRTMCTEIPFVLFDEQTLEAIIGNQRCEFADLLHTVTETPDKIKNSLGGMMVDPSRLRDAYQFTGRIRETVNERLCSMAGLPSDEYDMHSAMRLALGGQV